MFDAWGVPFVATVTGIIVIIWLYSHKSGIKTIIWTDWLQTLLFITALVLIVWQLSSSMGMNLGGYRGDHPGEPSLPYLSLR